MSQKRRRSFLVNPTFQLRYTFFTVSWLFPLLVVFPFLTFQVFEYVVEIASRLNLSADLLSDLQKTRGEVILLLMLAEVTFILAVSIISLRLSHAIAGPIHQLRTAIQSGRDTGTLRKAKFRKNDHFRELADDYNLLIQSVQTKYQEGTVGISEAVSKLEAVSGKLKSGEAKSEIDGALEELRKAREALSS